MEHSTIRHKLSEYIDGSVSAEEKREVEEHLKGCTACSDALRELKKTVEHIKTVEEVEPPAWMTQKIMAKVSAKARQKRDLIHLLFMPLHVKLPIQAVALLFLAVIAFSVYRNVQPTAKFETMPQGQFSTEKKAVPAVRSPEQTPAVTAKGELGKEKASSPRSEQVPQTPGYKALDMRQEYESLPAPVPAPAKPAGQPGQSRSVSTLEKDAAAPQTASPAMIRKQAETAAGSSEHAESKHEPVAPGLQDRTEERSNVLQVIIDRHPTGNPKLIVSYKIINSNKIRIAEERFNKDGERHGIQKEYYESGRVKTKAQYSHGRLDWFVEFHPDGVKKTGKSNYDWFWLKN